MNQRKINLSFGNYTEANFENKGSHIVSCMVDNPYFATPNPSLAVLQAAQERYSAALVAAANLGRNEVAEKNAARQDFDQLLNKLGLYVMNVADGNEQMLVSSGFTLTKIREPRYLAAAGPLVLRNGMNSGELEAIVKADRNANGYVFYISDNADTENPVWKNVAVSTCKYTFTELVQGKKYWVKVAITGARKQIAWSQVAILFVS